jgi:CheY-like chemotaxis protein
MPNQILFVDDDLMVLSSLERNLCLDFSVTVAECGPQGLEALKTSGPFAVVFSDMRMPEMDGVEFIQQARKISPDSIYMMLTGNQDVGTATKAVNEGHVFRILIKPCPVTEIRMAIAAAERQYELVTMEKQLLQRTFVGAIDVMTDVIESMQPTVVEYSGKVAALVEALESALGIKERWENRLAGRLAFLGIVLLPESQQHQFVNMSPTSPRSRELLASVAGASCRLIERIPRLERVTSIVKKQLEQDGHLPSGENSDELDVSQSATLLRVATHWVAMQENGVDRNAALQELTMAMPKLDPRILTALKNLSHEVADAASIVVAIDQLQEGMVLADDVVSCDGSLLLRKGRRLTRPIIEKLALHSDNDVPLQPICVVSSARRQTPSPILVA